MTSNHNEILEQKALVETIYTTGKVAFEEAINLCPLTVERGRNYFWSCLDSLSHGMNLFGVIDSETGELEFDQKKVFENINDYAVILGDLSIAENEFANQFKWLPNHENCIEIDKNLTGQGLITHNQIQIVGDIEQGIKLREQLY